MCYVEINLILYWNEFYKANLFLKAIMLIRYQLKIVPLLFIEPYQNLKINKRSLWHIDDSFATALFTLIAGNSNKSYIAIAKFYLHWSNRNWVVLSKEDEDAYFTLPLMLCFGNLKIKLKNFLWIPRLNSITKLRLTISLTCNC